MRKSDLSYRTLRGRLETSPVLARVLPFGLFALVTIFQSDFGPVWRFWIYLGKTVLGAWLVILTWPFVKEMRWSVSWPAVFTGVGVFALWVGLDGRYPPMDRILGSLGLGQEPANPWNPHLFFGENSAVAWTFIVVRIAGSSIVVPPLEEVFYRSFLYRSIASPDFASQPLGRFAWMPFLVTSIAFGISHREWVAGILCGFAYQGLVCWQKRL